jgi:hypothetical protein
MGGPGLSQIFLRILRRGQDRVLFDRWHVWGKVNVIDYISASREAPIDQRLEETMALRISGG